MLTRFRDSPGHIGDDSLLTVSSMTKVFVHAGKSIRFSRDDPCTVGAERAVFLNFPE